MLRAAIKHGISKALSSGAGFEVWDFEIKEEQATPDTVTVEIRYRYQPNLFFNAAITAKSVDGIVTTYEITAETVPGEVGEKDLLTISGRDELCRAIERWTAQIEEELSARPSNRLLAAQQKAISYLEKHLLDVPDQRLTRERIVEYRRRLERLEAAVIELKAPRTDHANSTRADEVREEFACLRRRLEVLGERSFLHAVLVRLVKYFWDDENLRIIEAGSRAAQDFLKDEDHPLSRASGTPARDEAEDDAPAKPAKAAPPAAPRNPARPEMPAAARTPAKPEPSRLAPRAAAMPESTRLTSPKPQVAAKAAAAKTPPAPEGRAQPKSGAAEGDPGASPERQRAAYKPLRPGRG